MPRIWALDLPILKQESEAGGHCVVRISNGDLCYQGDSLRPEPQADVNDTVPPFSDPTIAIFQPTTISNF